MKKLFSIILLSLSSIAFADPIVFSMELGKTTESEVKEMYRLIDDGVNYYSNGNQYLVDVKDVDLEDLEKLSIIFDEQKTLVAVLAKVKETNHMPHSKFEYLYKILAQKYRLVKKERPFVGTQFAKFKNGKTEITLEAPHMGGFKIHLEYIREDFLKKYRQISKQDKEEKTKEDSSLL